VNKLYAVTRERYYERYDQREPRDCMVLGCGQVRDGTIVFCVEHGRAWRAHLAERPPRARGMPYDRMLAQDRRELFELASRWSYMSGLPSRWYPL
jgi:hypothetical protein